MGTTSRIPEGGADVELLSCEGLGVLEQDGNFSVPWDVIDQARGVESNIGIISATERDALIIGGFLDGEVDLHDLGGFSIEDFQVLDLSVGLSEEEVLSRFCGEESSEDEN